MPIEFSTVYTKERLLRHSKFVAASQKLFWIMLIIMTIFAGTVYTLLAIIDALSSTATLYALLILWIDLVCVFCYFILPRFLIKKAKNLNSIVRYSFDTDNFRTNTVNAYLEESTTVQYSFLSKICKNKSELYLFVTRQMAYIIDLTELSPEQTIALKELLYTKVNQKKIKWPD